MLKGSSRDMGRRHVHSARASHQQSPIDTIGIVVFLVSHGCCGHDKRGPPAKHWLDSTAMQGCRTRLVSSLAVPWSEIAEATSVSAGLRLHSSRTFPFQLPRTLTLKRYHCRANLQQWRYKQHCECLLDICLYSSYIFDNSCGLSDLVDGVTV